MKKTLLLSMLLAGGLAASAQVAGDDQPLANGTVVPDFTAPDLNNNMHSLYANYLNAGKSVVIDFSATWCSPCWQYHKSHALADFYEAYGPAGSNEAMVIFVEGDVPNTTTANLYGENGPIAPSQGDWVTGTPYPIIEDTQALGLGNANKFDVEYFPTMYIICQGTKTSISADQMTPAQIRNAMGNCQTLTGIPNHGRIDQSTAALKFCESGQSALLQAKLKNFGNNVITNAVVVLKKDGEVIDTKTFTNSLAQFGTAANINFPNTVFTAGSNYTLELVSINGVAQTNPELTTVPVQFTIAAETENTVEVRVYTDFYPAENGWELKDAAGNVLASGGPYQAGNEDQWGGGGEDANTIKSHMVTLTNTNPECVTVVLNDVGTFDDGWGAVPAGAEAPGIEIYSNGQLIFQRRNVGNFGDQLSTTKAFRAMGTLGNEEIANNTFAMYPNPTTGILNFSTQEPVDVTVVDLTGKTVFTAKGIENGGNVNLGSLQSGMYVAKIKGLTTEKIEKIVIE
ncbi:T9SS type A sorting domain-containing protein [Flavobacterium sp. MFBS3-15]|uniref:T9SS type A sorting domain-containing protein n=1 Tax=Flavobacterium sp. MFBS3-15 TaxID=2989816 RepID=UPI0022358611|nr:T9SS type A sorting domain-containing protein [Flavobacterium sp. MFBS3-15]MCW4469336.1 T9SS type A sorting domain-containing protein [Flavobacterium sp. MFBS3-15]